MKDTIIFMLPKAHQQANLRVLRIHENQPFRNHATGMILAASVFRRRAAYSKNFETQTRI